jgi:predicted short-subunit dehydrogenase-like oxidoreductase (DUF2520 family)
VAVRKIQNIVLIGAGNLATNLGVALHELKFNVAQVYNRTPEKGKALAARIGADYTEETEAIILNADIYILAVTDSVIEEVAMKLPLKDQLVVHTAGTIDMNILAHVSENIGVFYPVQTFPGKSRINFTEVPICLEANSPHVETHLAEFANKLSKNVHFLDSSNRKILHLSAVFASNFTNFMNVLAEDLLNDYEIPFDLLKPIIRQTGKNARRNRLFRYQTGPAVRGDNLVLQKHRDLLAAYPEYLELYNLISDNIIKYKALHGKL